jgi:hypothetical protein
MRRTAIVAQLGTSVVLFLCLVSAIPAYAQVEKKEEHKEEKPAALGTSRLQKIWDKVNFEAGLNLQPGYQLVGMDERPYRILSSIDAALAFDASSFARFKLAGRGGGAVSFLAVDASEDLGPPVVDPYIALGDSSLSFMWDSGEVSIGNLEAAYGTRFVSAFADVLAPRDYRRGIHFRNPANRIGQWAAEMSQSFDKTTLKGFLSLKYNGPQGSLVASDIGGFAVGRYQVALIKKRGDGFGVFGGNDRSRFSEEGAAFQSPTGALSVRHTESNFDVGFFAAYGYNEVISINRSSSLLAFISFPYRSEAFGSQVQQRGTWPCEVRPFTEGPVLQECAGPHLFSYDRNLALVVDGSAKVGPARIQAQALFEPYIQGVSAKSAVLMSKESFHTLSSSSAAFVIGVLGGYQKWIDAKVEVFERFWTSVPAGSYLFGIEPFSADVSTDRIVHRAALAFDLQGALVLDGLRWELRGEAGLSSLDILAGAEIYYQWKSPRVFVGAAADLFFGAPGTPGWMLQDATFFSAFVGIDV